MVSLIRLPSRKLVFAQIYRRETVTPRPDIPIIFIPGILNTTKTFTPLIPHLPEYTRIVYDMAGHGETPAGDATITITSLAQDINDVLAYYGYQHAIVVGHSAGAILALQFAAQFPGKAEKLILMGPLRLPLIKVEQLNNANLIRGLPMVAMVRLTFRPSGQGIVE